MDSISANAHEGHNHPKEFTIIVNGRQKVATDKELTYAQVVALAFENPHTDESWLYVITYTRGEGNKKGELEPGEVVKVKDGMIFNVTETNRS